MVLGWHLG